jgi:AraC-like DNA-binding protein
MAGFVIDPTLNEHRAYVEHELLRHYPAELIVLYVRQTPESLKGVLKLSRLGITSVFVHPISVGDRPFVNAVENLLAFGLVLDLEAAIEARMAALPERFSKVVRDVLRRPYRYGNASDVASEASSSKRSLYQALEEVGLTSPRSIVDVAKVAHGISRLPAKPINEVSRFLGYPRPDLFTRQVRRYAGCNPSRVRQVNRSELLVNLVECLFKPARTRTRFSLKPRFLSGESSQSAPLDTVPASRPASRRSTP